MLVFGSFLWRVVEFFEEFSVFFAEVGEGGLEGEVWRDRGSHYSDEVGTASLSSYSEWINAPQTAPL